MNQNSVILIPAYNPPGSLAVYVKLLLDVGFRDIIVVNDGSKAEKDVIFEKISSMGAIVLKHEKNRGKGAALKSGFIHYVENYEGKADGVITVNADSREPIRDVVKIAEALHAESLSETNRLVLGSRDFQSPNMRRLYKHDNRVSTILFNLVMNIHLEDSMTGLRGIPDSKVHRCVHIGGNRYTYATAMVIDFQKDGYMQVPVSVAQQDPEAEVHFRRGKDLILIYLLILKKLILFGATSLMVTVIDLVLFHMLSEVLLVGIPARIIYSTIIARIVSATLNYLLSRALVFKSNESRRKSTRQFIVLSICQCMISALMVQGLQMIIRIEPVIIKALVDLFLFFINYSIQNRFIFKN